LNISFQIEVGATEWTSLVNGRLVVTSVYCELIGNAMDQTVQLPHPKFPTYDVVDSKLTPPRMGSQIKAV